MSKSKLICVLVILYFFLPVESNSSDHHLACPKLHLKNGRVRYRQKGRFVKFLCNVGFLTAGEKYSTCHNGEWDSEIPKCVRNNCKKLSPPTNGLIYPSHRGAVSNFFCKPDYTLRGPNVTYCDGHDWDQKLPSCIQSNTTPPLKCDFESEDLCGWNNDVGHDFDWRRTNLKTPSGHLGTGPSYDHTKGNGQTGFYMYIEASSRNINDTARLISPIYDSMNSTNVCLEFYYHMYGFTTGQLRVYVKKISESWNLEPSSAKFWRMGNHGDQWLKSLIQLGPISEDFQIIFEGIRGESYYSDIAIDDVEIVANCVLPQSTTNDGDLDYTTPIMPTFESCRDRCNKESGTTIMPDVIACKCTEDCVDDNLCCPDYLSECVIGVTDGYYEDDETTIFSTTMKQAEDATKIIRHSTVNITTSVYPIIFAETTPTTITTKLPTTKASPTITTTSTTTMASTSPSTTVSTKATSKTSTSSTVKSSTTESSTLSFIVPRKDENRQKEHSSNEIPLVPKKFLIPKYSPQSTSRAMTEASTTPAIIKEYIHKSKTPEHIQLKHGFNSKVIIIAVGSIGAIMLLIVSSIYLKRHCKTCGHLNKMKKHYGSDSQSDVRFLTGDEILNFNLASPDDY